MSTEEHLPEGVIDADPPGGWESGGAADAETAQQSADAEGSPRLSDDPAPVERASVDSEEVQSDRPGQVADPDLDTSEER